MGNYASTFKEINKEVKQINALLDICIVHGENLEGLIKKLSLEKRENLIAREIKRELHITNASVLCKQLDEMDRLFDESSLSSKEEFNYMLLSEKLQSMMQTISIL